MGKDEAMLRAVLAGLAVAALVAGCGGDVDPARTPAGMAQVRFLENLYSGKLAQAYETLHPAYQRIVPRSSFVQCTRQAGLGGLDSIEILDVYDDPATLPDGGQVSAKAIRVRLTSTTGKPETFVSHEVKVGPGWRWILNGKALGAYRAGKCPAA
jgi:hypothetical protein